MTYSPDIKKRVLEFVKNGGRKIEASRRFLVSRGVVYAWLKEEDPFAARARQVRQGKIDRATLMRHVQDKPDVYQRELADDLGVTQAAVSKMLRTLGLVKKTASVRRARRYEKDDLRGSTARKRKDLRRG
jgi:transposase